MRVPAKVVAGFKEADLSEVPEDKLDYIRLVRYIADEDEYEVIFDLEARITELEALLSQQ